MIYALGDRTPILEGNNQFIAVGARIIGNVRLQSAASVWFNCVLRGDNDWIEVGERSNVQDGCVLHTDPGYPLTIGQDVTIGHWPLLPAAVIQTTQNSLLRRAASGHKRTLDQQVRPQSSDVGASSRSFHHFVTKPLQCLPAFIVKIRRHG